MTDALRLDSPYRHFRLVRLYEPRIALDIGGEDRGEPALDALWCHGNASLRETRIGIILATVAVSVDGSKLAMSRRVRTRHSGDAAWKSALGHKQTSTG